MGQFFRLVIMLASLGAVGCTTVGNEFPSNVEWIRQGATTQKDVRDILGQPYQVGNSSGTPTWTYAFYKYSLFGPKYSKELKFYWDKKSTVDRYTFTSSFPTDLDDLKPTKSR